jgi:beta-N-acetylhexosaminidase
MIQLMHSFYGLMPPADFLAAVERGEVGAFCLFRYNVESLVQLRDLTTALHQAALRGGQPPPLIGIDQEGGQLMAVMEGATELPGNMALGAAHSPELAERAGWVLGRELLALGINMDFAPSLDVNINPANPVIGTRSFGEDPALVTGLGLALVRGLTAAGVVATAKHFPGHGDVDSDTHFGAPSVNHPLTRVEQVELYPFREAIAAGVPAIMSAHVLFPAMEPDPQLPATLSRRILTDLLRGQMGFNGLIVTDAMDMHAVAQFGAEPSVRAALEAGVDLALLGHLPDQLALGRTLESVLRPESAARIHALRETLPTDVPPLSVVGCEEHQQIAQQIADRAITVVRGDGRLRVQAGQRVAVVTVKPADLTPADTSSEVRIYLAEALQQRGLNATGFELPMNADDAVVRGLLEAVVGYDAVVVGTILAERDPSQAALVRALHERGQKPLVVALRTPYDLTAFPMIEDYVCCYSVRPVAIEAVARLLCGEIEAQGRLPCRIPGLT